MKIPLLTKEHYCLEEVRQAVNKIEESDYLLILTFYYNDFVSATDFKKEHNPKYLDIYQRFGKVNVSSYTTKNSCFNTVVLEYLPMRESLKSLEHIRTYVLENMLEIRNVEYLEDYIKMDFILETTYEKVKVEFKKL